MDTFEDVVIGFNAKVQEMLKPMTAVYKSGVVDALSSVGKAYANMNLGITQSEMIKSMNAMAESFLVSKVVANSFATTQILAESVKTAEMIQKQLKILMKKRLRAMKMSDASSKQRLTIAPSKLFVVVKHFCNTLFENSPGISSFKWCFPIIVGMRTDMIVPYVHISV